MNRRLMKKSPWKTFVGALFFYTYHCDFRLNFWLWFAFISVNRKGLKGLTNGIVLASMVHLCASFVIVTYAAVIFENVGVTKMDPYISVVQIGVMQIIGPLCTSKFSDSLGRKKLLILSLLGSAFGLLLFALYSYLHESGYQMHHYEWIPVISLSFVIFTASAGVVPLVYLCIVENLPSKVWPNSSLVIL